MFLPEAGRPSAPRALAMIEVRQYPTRLAGPVLRAEVAKKVPVSERLR